MDYYFRCLKIKKELFSEKINDRPYFSFPYLSPFTIRYRLAG